MPSSSRDEEGCPSSPKKEGVMAMVIFFRSSVKSCGGDHGISSREEGAWEGKEYDHGHLSPFLSKELRTWSWHIV